MGCDGPVSYPVLQIECPVCGNQPAPECDFCEAGIKNYFECPHRLITPTSIRAIQLYVQLQKGILPAPGGWYQQTPPYIRFMTHLSQLAAQYEAEQRNQD